MGVSIKAGVLRYIGNFNLQFLEVTLYPAVGETSGAHTTVRAAVGASGSTRKGSRRLHEKYFLLSTGTQQSG